MRILTVDDEEVSKAKLKTLLATYGDCDTASNGSEALEMIKKASADGRPYMLITMDISMPGMSGKEVVAAIRTWEQERRLAGARIIMVTASTEMLEISASMKAGCDGYLMKPFTPENVDETLDNLGIRLKLGLRLKPPPKPSGASG